MTNTMSPATNQDQLAALLQQPSVILIVFDNASASSAQQYGTVLGGVSKKGASFFSESLGAPAPTAAANGDSSVFDINAARDRSENAAKDPSAFDLIGISYTLDLDSPEIAPCVDDFLDVVEQTLGSECRIDSVPTVVFKKNGLAGPGGGRRRGNFFLKYEKEFWYNMLKYNI